MGSRLDHIDFKRMENPDLPLGRVWYVWCRDGWRLVTGRKICSECGADVAHRFAKWPRARYRPVRDR